jgi:hypothetical protein
MRARAGLVVAQFAATLAAGKSLGFEKEFHDCRKTKPNDQN